MGQLPTLIAAIVLRQTQYDKLKFDERLEHQLGPPAKPAEIESLGRRLGAELPLDYRQFLALNDGWCDFDGDGKLLATTDHTQAWVQERVAEWCSIWDPDADNPLANGALPVMIGESKNSFLVLDPRSTGANGGCVFALYDFMVLEETFQSFTAYLQRRLEILDTLVARETLGDHDEASNDP